MAAALFSLRIQTILNNFFDNKCLKACLTIYMFLSYGLVYGDQCVQVPTNPCKCVSVSNRYSVDLWPLLQGIADDTPRFKARDPKQENVEYSYSPCKNFNEKISVCNDVAVCMLNTTKKRIDYEALGTQATAQMSGDAEAGTLLINYTAKGDDGVTRYSQVNLKCSESGAKLDALGEDQLQKLHYAFALHTDLACVKQSSLSAGSILLIVCVVLLAVYFIGGVLYMRFYGGAQGIEQIPNLEFWKDLPSLIRDGVTFTLNGCKADTSYQQI